MSAQPVGPPPRPSHKITLPAIRAALPDDQHAAYDAERDNLDVYDLQSFVAFREKWRARGVLAEDSELEADRVACMAGDLDLVGPWPLGVR